MDRYITCDYHSEPICAHVFLEADLELSVSLRSQGKEEKPNSLLAGRQAGGNWDSSTLSNLRLSIKLRADNMLTSSGPFPIRLKQCQLLD